MRNTVNAIFILMASVLAIQTVNAQTVNAEYLNPVLGSSTYKFVRIGTTSAYYGGIMWNNNSPDYGNGNDFSVFTYGNRDMTFRTGTGNLIVFPSQGGRMGIGTQSPTARLDVRSSLAAGIPTLAVNSTFANYSTEPGLNRPFTIRRSSSNNESVATFIQDVVTHVVYTNDEAASSIEYRLINTDSEGANNGANASDNLVMALKSSTAGPSVGIGTKNTAGYSLAVNGKIRAKEVKIETGWADFVFEPGYDLPTLEEVESHITEHGHLPDIPSAAHVEENGVNLGEMESRLLQKIEELTLYVIEQNKQIKAQQQTMQAMQNEINHLKGTQHK